MSFSVRIIAFLIVAIFSGCGHNGPETVPVSGRVTFGGGDCPGGGTIYFQPLAQGTDELPARPATADFAADGAYRVSSFSPTDGLVPGEYRVRIECWLRRAEGYNRPGETWGPGTFHAAESLVVESGQRSVTADFDIPRN